MSLQRVRTTGEKIAIVILFVNVYKNKVLTVLLTFTRMH
ncbi:hypothetical protein KN10_0374 [Anoxybacillus flavithermus NBRC 109594]|uniref:Transposase n=1 Tax=Anoxybacillus flavithermus NBRC 109594 TaxID=1315967 RepID=R4FZA6_9BACL|nr:hypothetical protein KN10_0374 [Anoxybacillus flavithermus NBRC 109594]